MALQQMEGFELAGRTVSPDSLPLHWEHSTIGVSFVSIPFMKKGRPSTLNKILLTNLEVRESATSIVAA